MATQKQTNMLPFTQIVRDILTNDKAQENRELSLIACMMSMETTFPHKSCTDFIKASGKDKATRISKVLVELYPDYKDLVERSTVNPKDGKNEAEKAKLEDTKQDAQKSRKKLENMLRRAMFSVFYLHEVKAEDANVNHKTSRMEFLVPKYPDKPDNKVKLERSVTRGDLERYGKQKAKDKGLVEAKETAGNTNKGTVAGSKASNGVSIAQVASTAMDAITEMSKALVLVLKTPNAKLSDKQEAALQELEAAVLRHFWTKEDGKLDLKGLADIYAKVETADTFAEVKFADNPKQETKPHDKPTSKPATSKVVKKVA